MLPRDSRWYLAGGRSDSLPSGPHDLRYEAIQRQYLIGDAERDGLLRHTEYDRCRLVLSNGQRADLLHFQQTMRTVIAHAGHDDANAIGPDAVRRRAEGRYQRAVLDRHVVTRAAALQQHI